MIVYYYRVKFSTDTYSKPRYINLLVIVNNKNAYPVTHENVLFLWLLDIIQIASGFRN